MTPTASKTDSALARAYHRAFSIGAMAPHAQTILPLLARPRGKFVEVGARDGAKESFTGYLEKGLGWRGLLIEPWPHLFHKCRRNRRGSVSLNVAAVDSWLKDSFIEVVGSPPSVSIRQELRREAKERIVGKPVAPPPKRGKRDRVHYIATNALTAILERANFDAQFDLLVLNLPGYETNALEGLDFGRFKPTFLLVRAGHGNKPLPFLPPYYERVATSRHDKISALHLFRFADFGPN